MRGHLPLARRGPVPALCCRPHQKYKVGITFFAHCQRVFLLQIPIPSSLDMTLWGAYVKANSGIQTCATKYILACQFCTRSWFLAAAWKRSVPPSPFKRTSTAGGQWFQVLTALVTSLKRDCWQHFFSSCGCPPTQCGPDQIFEERTCECRSLLSARIRTTVHWMWFLFVGEEGNKSAVADAKTAVVEANAWSSTTKNGTLRLARAGDTRIWNAHKMDKWDNM